MLTPVLAPVTVILVSCARATREVRVRKRADETCILEVDDVKVIICERKTQDTEEC